MVEEKLGRLLQPINYGDRSNQLSFKRHGNPAGWSFVNIALFEHRADPVDECAHLWRKIPAVWIHDGNSGWTVSTCGKISTSWPSSGC